MPRKPTFTDEEPTPPPQEPPPLPRMGRTPTPGDLRHEIEMMHAHQSELTRAIGTLWDARKDAERLDRLEGKIDSYLLGAARNDELINKVIWPHAQQTMVKLDLCLQQLTVLGQLQSQLNQVREDVDSAHAAISDVEQKRKATSDRLRTITEKTEAEQLRLSNRVAQLEAHATGDKRELQVIDRQSRRKRQIIKWIVGGVVSLGSAIVGYLSK